MWRIGELEWLRNCEGRCDALEKLGSEEDLEDFVDDVQADDFKEVRAE